jgi:glycerol-3-phosphate dehydrogenase (NAD(P)+)
MKIGFIGAGSWGTALAMALNDNGHQVALWTIEDSTIWDIQTKNENSRYLPNIKISEKITFTKDLKEALTDADMVVNALPSQVSRSVLPKVSELLNQKTPLFITVSKGIENKTYKRVSEIMMETCHLEADKVVALSGPSHAEEVAKKVPTAIVAASASLDSAKMVQDVFSNAYLRVYAHNDIIGVELGGALKNIIALAAGITDGAGFGDNTKAALMTRGLVEIKRLGEALGAQSATFAGLSGIGDLIVTCMSKHSRNRYVGEQIGKGRKLQEVLDEMVMVAEGVKTTVSAYELSQKMSIEMPITEQIYSTLFKEKSPQQAMVDLMTRASKVEDWT